MLLFDKAPLESYDYLLSTLFRVMRNNKLFFDKICKSGKDFVITLEQGIGRFMNYFLTNYNKPYGSQQQASALGSSASGSSFHAAKECERLAGENRKRRLHQLELVRQAQYQEFLESIHYDSDEEFTVDEATRDVEMRESNNSWKPKTVLQNLGVLLQLANPANEKEKTWVRDDAEKLALRGTATLEYKFKIDGI